MNYSEIIQGLPENKSFSRKELFQKMKETNPTLNYNSYKWILNKLVKEGSIYRNGYNSYRCGCRPEMAEYVPLYSEQAKRVKELVEKEYPLAMFCIFESFLLNEFLNHQIAENTLVIQMEKELGAFLFDFLDEVYDGRVLYKPDQKNFQRYWCENCIVIVDRVSEAPKDKENPHDMIIEKLLVDIFSEPVIRNLFSSSEYPLIMETAQERYLIDKSKMMRYAKRRNALTKIKEYIE